MASFGRKVLTSTPSLIVGANTKRQSLLLTNVCGVDVFLGPDDTVTGNTGIMLAASGAAIAETKDAGGMHLGDWYGVASVTAIVTYWEREGAR